MLRCGLITPYRGVHYYLKEYSKNSLENPEELFNLWHSLLRNIIERAFGVLKKKICHNFRHDRILIFSWYSYRNGIACCILHNYLIGIDPDEILIAEVDQVFAHSEIPIETNATMRENDQDAKQEA